jgi:hypothetical protein
MLHEGIRSCPTVNIMTVITKPEERVMRAMRQLHLDEPSVIEALKGVGNETENNYFGRVRTRVSLAPPLHGMRMDVYGWRKVVRHRVWTPAK